jgi:hypothetical protein
MEGNQFMSCTKYLLSLCTILGAVSFGGQAFAGDIIEVHGGVADGYDTVYCPNGYQLRQCQFNSNSCDNTSQGRDSCSADSRNHRKCDITAVCERPRQSVRIQGRTNNGYARAYCPRDYSIRSCSFDRNNCDNTSTSYDYCEADSRNHRDCRFTGICDSN